MGNGNIETQIKNNHTKVLSYPDHNTDSEDCWCEPEIIKLDNGNTVVVHNDFQ